MAGLPTLGLPHGALKKRTSHVLMKRTCRVSTTLEICGSTDPEASRIFTTARDSLGHIRDSMSKAEGALPGCRGEARHGGRPCVAALRLLDQSCCVPGLAGRLLRERRASMPGATIRHISVIQCGRIIN